MTLEQKIQEWIVNESSLISEGRMKHIPELSTLTCLSEGKNRKVWNYIIKHVRSRHSTERIKRILKAKHIEDERKKAYKTATYFTDLNNLKEKVTSLKESCEFLKTSVTNKKERILSADSSIRKLRNSIDELNQKTTVLEIITSKHKEKCATLTSLMYQFDFYISKKLTSVKKNDVPIDHFQSSYEKDNFEIEFIVTQVLALVLKKLNDSKDFEPTKVSVKKMLDKKLNSVPISELLFHLQRLSETSYYNALNRQALIVKDMNSYKTQTGSQKQIQDMKMNHIKSVLCVKKIKKEIENLSNVKDSLMKSNIHSINIFMDSEFQQKVKLLQIILENEGLMVSLSYFKDTLSTILKDNQEMLEKVNQVPFKDVENKIVKFYRDFDLLWDLIKLVPNTFNEIKNYISFLQLYANEQVFSAMTSDLLNFSEKLEIDLKARMDIFWSKCDERKLIMPLLNDPIPKVPDVLWHEIKVPCFYQANMIASKVKQIKEVLKGYQEDKFQFKYDSALIAEEKFQEMMSILHQLQNYLDSNIEVVELGSDAKKELTLAVKNWWEQGAQYILKIIYDGKTLKMWQDILMCLPDF